MPRDGPVAPHHDLKNLDRHPVRDNAPLELLAVSSALRDRHFVSAMRAYTTSGRTSESEQDAT